MQIALKKQLERGWPLQVPAVSSCESIKVVDLKLLIMWYFISLLSCHNCIRLLHMIVYSECKYETWIWENWGLKVPNLHLAKCAPALFQMPLAFSSCQSTPAKASFEAHLHCPEKKLKLKHPPFLGILLFMIDTVYLGKIPWVFTQGKESFLKKLICVLIG